LTILFSFALRGQELAPVVFTIPLSLPQTVRNTPCIPGGQQIPLHGTNHYGIAQMATASCHTGRK